MRFAALATLAVALLLVPVAAAPPAAAVKLPDEGYARVVQAYRGQLTEAEIARVAETDPAPELYLSPQTPGERAAARFFGSLPDETHAQLGATGYLKWRVDRLPSEQRGWLKEAARVLETRGQGPFPLTGKTPAYTGFARIQVQADGLPQYCWWIGSEGAPRLAWVTLVRAVGLLTEDYSHAYARQLPELVGQAETPLPTSPWVRVRETPAKPKPVEAAAEAPKPLMDEKRYWDLVRAFRGDLKKDGLRALTEHDRLLSDHLKSSDATTKALNELFAKMPEEQHQLLLYTGRIVWTGEDLNKQQRKLVDTILKEVNARGDGVEPFLLSPALATRTGFALVFVPEVETPVISWWVSSPNTANPTWIPLLNSAAVAAPGYYRAHLEQLPRG